MDRETFAKHLCLAATSVVPLTREFVLDPLPDATAYLVYLNQSFDENPLRGDEELFPDDSLEGEPAPCDAGAVIRKLYRSGKIPEWINVSVARADAETTCLRLDYCGRFTAQDDPLYHPLEGYPPFHCLGPPLPPYWKSAELNGKFALHWRSEPAAPRLSPLARLRTGARAVVNALRKRFRSS